MLEIIAIVTSSVTILAAAIITGLFARQSLRYKKDSEKAELRAKRREMESLLNMKLTSANTRLSLAIARAVKEGSSNGDLECAVKNAKEAQIEYFNFVNTDFARNVAKI